MPLHTERTCPKTNTTPDSGTTDLASRPAKIEVLETRVRVSPLEITRAEYELVELQAIEARQRFLEELARHPDMAELYRAAQLLEAQALEARRARREAEVLERLV